MTDKKLTDSEIVNALSKVRYGGHGCKNCKYDDGKGDDRCGLKGCKIARYALDLITRQQAKIEEFMKETAVTTLIDDAVVYTPTIEDFKKFKKKFKSEAAKECAEKLKEKSIKIEFVCSGALVRTDYTITKDDLDNLVKEMEGENDD